MSKFRLSSKIFTIYDETDSIKRMKDSDILAEKKRSTSAVGTTLKGGIAGGLGGAALGSLAGAGLGAFAAGKAGVRAGNVAGGALGGAKGGALAAATVGALGGMAYNYFKGRKQRKENSQYNKRLEYAQRQAMRRERADWKTNLTQREGYSY